MRIYRNPPERYWPSLVKRPLINRTKLRTEVERIIRLVRQQGDSALRTLTFRFDHVRLDQFRVSETELHKAVNDVSPDLQKAIAVAAANIKKFHAAQLHHIEKIQTSRYVHCWRKQVPIERVGLYIPGGQVPLFSTVLMLGIPALLAGCDEIIICSPPDQRGRINSSILYACHYLGLEKVYKIGGAQAIAAMAYGTSCIPAVYKIFGPGNQYVTLAKQLVQQEGIGIDMPAGPSEVLVLADKTANPDFIAADLLSQAEHGVDSQVILVTTDARLLTLVQKSVQRQVAGLPRKKIAQKSLRGSKLIAIYDLSRAIRFSNLYAPEHLILNLSNPGRVIKMIKNAGSVFIGPYTPEAAGDYASGTNHTLPTNGFTRTESGIGVESFMKTITFQKISRRGLSQLGPYVQILARAENLHGHSAAVQVRLAIKEKS
jgi:histidinol dehydrogenase